MAGVGGATLARRLGDWPAAAPRGPSYTRLAAALRALVLDGRLPLETRLPAERDLARALAVSRTTVTAAYDALREQGYARSRQGAGTWVALPAGHEHGGGVLTATAPDGIAIDLAIAAPEPVPGVLGPALEAAARRAPAHLRGAGYDVQGLPLLREAVAARYAARGLPTTPEQVVVSAGGLGGIDLVARALLGPGDRVLTDSPTYPNAVGALRRTGARLTGVALTDDGWDLDLVESALRTSLPRVAYVVADHANPTGHVLPADGRAALVSAARRCGTTVLVDEALVDLALDGQPLPPPVAAYDDEGTVVSVGSASKSFWGGLRIGWVRAPKALVARLLEARVTTDLASPVLDQLVAAELLSDPEPALIARRTQLLARRDALVTALAEHCPHWSVRVPSGGLTLWVRLDAPVATALSGAAERLGVRIVPGSRFTLDSPAERWVRLPFSLPEPTLVEAVRRLATARAEVGDTVPVLPRTVVA